MANKYDAILGEYREDDAASFKVDINRFGFLNQTETTIVFDGTNTFTLASVGASWSYYRAGIKYTISGNKTVTIAGSPVPRGTYFIYIDSTVGTLTASLTPWTLNDTIVPVAILLFNDSLTPKYHLADERHTCLIDRRDHYYLHMTEGAKLRTRGALGGTYTINTDTDAAKTFSIAESVILDEDIIVTATALAEPNGTDANYMVAYRDTASTWVWKASAMPFVYNTTSNWIQWDNAGTITDATGGGGALTRWVNSYLIITNLSGAGRFLFVPSQNIFTTLAAAQSENPQAFTWTGFPIAEAVIAYRLTWSTITSTSKGKCVLAASPQTINLTSVSSTTISPMVNDHGLLSGLTDDDHPQYLKTTTAAATYLPLAGGTMTGDIDLGEKNIKNGFYVLNEPSEGTREYSSTPTTGVSFSDINTPDTGNFDGCTYHDILAQTTNCSAFYTAGYQVNFTAYYYWEYDGVQYFSTGSGTCSGLDPCNSYDVNFIVSALQPCTGLKIWRTYTLDGCNYLTESTYITSTGTYYGTSMSWSSDSLPPANSLPYSVAGDVTGDEDAMGTYFPYGKTVSYQVFSYIDDCTDKYFNINYSVLNVSITSCSGGDVTITLDSMPTGADGVRICRYDDNPCVASWFYFDFTYASQSVTDSGYALSSGGYPILRQPYYSGGDVIPSNSLYYSTLDGRIIWIDKNKNRNLLTY